MDDQVELVPANFGTVQSGIYRSAYPSEKNLKFLADELGLRSVVYLVGGSRHCSEEFLKKSGIRLFQIGLKGKGTLRSSSSTSLEDDVMRKIASVVLEPSNLPVLIHCHGGKHRSGRAVACLRKLYNWTLEDILSEYRSFAGDKRRDIDEKLITDFFDR